MKTTTDSKAAMYARIRAHGLSLLAVFPNAVERDPVKLCKRLRRIEADGAAFALRLCNGPEWPSESAQECDGAAILGRANRLLGNVHEYQPKTGAACGCRRGVQRDNCPACEGTGRAINFRAIRNRPALVPVFLNRDPRGYALKISDEWMRNNPKALPCDWGGYGIIAPDMNNP